MNEEWCLIPGYGTRYSASTFGRIRANYTKRGPCFRILSDFQQKGKKYRRVNLYHPVTDELRQWGVHQLVAMTFIGPYPSPLHEVNHKDTDHTNNRLDNLEYVTHQGNMDHAVENGLIRKMKGEQNGTAKFTDLDAIDIQTCLDIGCPDWELAAVYGVSETAIGNIRRGQSWRHVRAWRLGEANELEVSEQRGKYADQIAARDAIEI